MARKQSDLSYPHGARRWRGVGRTGSGRARIRRRSRNRSTNSQIRLSRYRGHVGDGAEERRLGRGPERSGAPYSWIVRRAIPDHLVSRPFDSRRGGEGGFRIRRTRPDAAAVRSEETAAWLELRDG